jgi:hypothetical protein
MFYKIDNEDKLALAEFSICGNVEEFFFRVILFKTKLYINIHIVIFAHA